MPVLWRNPVSLKTQPKDAMYYVRQIRGPEGEAATAAFAAAKRAADAVAPKREARPTPTLAKSSWKPLVSPAPAPTREAQIQAATEVAQYHAALLHQQLHQQQELLRQRNEKQSELEAVMVLSGFGCQDERASSPGPSGESSSSALTLKRDATFQSAGNASEDETVSLASVNGSEASESDAESDTAPTKRRRLDASGSGTSSRASPCPPSPSSPSPSTTLLPPALAVPPMAQAQLSPQLHTMLAAYVGQGGAAAPTAAVPTVIAQAAHQSDWTMGRATPRETCLWGSSLKAQSWVLPGAKRSRSKEANHAADAAGLHTMKWKASERHQLSWECTTAVV